MAVPLAKQAAFGIILLYGTNAIENLDKPVPKAGYPKCRLDLVNWYTRHENVPITLYILWLSGSP